ncbi:MAG: ABC transporter ATP-binding protein [Gammaproteobacteria bacterium]|nr:MAG: ABC transporter ATP-binding protein [Gammaproteobacteria bacterium]
MPQRTLLEVRGLVTAFDTEGGRVRAVDRVDFSLERGRTLGIVGESGCGKSVTALSIMRLLPQPMGQIVAGTIRFEGTDLVSADQPTLHRIRGGRIGMIFQEPMTALNPVHRIGRQIAESLILHKGIERRAALERAVGMLERVGIPAPELRLSEYPHQLSGGMRQRVMIAIALACDPALLIADEPTTALDVTVQAQILELIAKLRSETGMGVMLITHDLGVIAEQCDDVVVMYAGRVAEQAPVKDLFARPLHPYTRGLLDSIPHLETPRKSRLPTIAGMVPTLKDLPDGCRFNNRCPHADDRCRREQPLLSRAGDGHLVACHHWQRIAGEVRT